MKQIRLSSLADAGGVFEANFREDLIIGPNSSISLKNLVTDILPSSIVVDDTNNTFEFSCSARGKNANGFFEVDLTNGAFTPDEFVAMFNQAINQCLDIDFVNHQGFEWQASIDETTQNFTLAFAREPDMDFPASMITSKCTYAATDGDLTKVGADTDFSSFACTPNHFIRGCGKISFVVSTGAFLSGLAQEISASSGVVPLQDYYAGVGVDNLGRYVVYGPLGGVTQLIDEQEANDAISIYISDGNLFVEAHRTNGDLIFNNQEEISLIESFQFVITLISAAAQTVTNILWNPTPFEVTLSDGSVRKKTKAEINTGIIYDKSIGATPTKVEIEMADPIRYLLGFQSSNYSMKANNGSFNAEYSFFLNNVPKTICVECLSLNLESYDSLTYGRSNILSVIPYQSDDEGQLIYEASFPIFLNLRNYLHPISIRNLKFRIVGLAIASSTPTVVTGLASMTILIDSK